jgi:ParB/RepB/Spo0J family partition protein
MATTTKTADATKGMKAGNGYFLVDPSTIKKGRQSRYFDHSEKDVLDKVESYKENGQLTPITCRQLADKSLEVYDGFCRLEAALKYNELNPKSPMKLKVIVTGDNAKNAFIKGLLNNHERKSTSVVDDAFAFKTLREEHGYKDKDIAEMFNTNPTKVSLCKKLTTLRDHILQLVHRKELAFDTAIALTEFNDTTQDEILALSETYREKQQQDYNERMTVWLKEKKEIDASVAPPEFDNGEATPNDPADRPEGKIPAKKPAAKKEPPAPPESANAAAKRAIREKQAEAAARKAAGESTAGDKGGNGKKKPDKILPPTFAQLKQNIKEEFIDIEDCPEPLFTLMGILMEYMTGEIDQKMWSKDCKAESKKYEFRTKE